MNAWRTLVMVFGGMVGAVVAFVIVSAMHPMPGYGHIAIGFLCTIGGMAVADTFYDVLH